MVKGLVSAQHPDSSTTKPCCCFGLTLSYWNMQGLPWKRCSLDGCRCCSKTCTCQHWWSLSRCAGYQFHRHQCTPPMPWEMQAFKLSADYMPGGQSPLKSVENSLKFSKRFSVLIHLNTEQISTFPQSIKMSFGPEKMRVFLDHVHIWLLLCMTEL